CRRDVDVHAELAAASKTELLPGLGHFGIGGEFALVGLGDGTVKIFDLLARQLVLRSASRHSEEQFTGHVLTIGWERPHRLYPLLKQSGHSAVVPVPWVHR